jgi:hypothetical protein
MTRTNIEDRIEVRAKLVDEHISLENQHDLEGVMGTFGVSAHYDDEYFMSRRAQWGASRQCFCIPSLWQKSSGRRFGGGIKAARASPRPRDLPVDIAITCSLVRRGGPVLVHQAAVLLHAPLPRDDALALRQPFATIMPGKGLSPPSFRSCSAHKSNASDGR